VKVAVAADHAGIGLKAAVCEWLAGHGFAVTDLGPFDTQSVDYPDYAGLVAGGVSRGEFEFGVLVCGTGIGMSIAANKFPGVRAALCMNEFMARAARGHNNANILCLGARVVAVNAAIDVVAEFFCSGFEGGRHELRLSKISEIEKCRVK